MVVLPLSMAKSKAVFIFKGNLLNFMFFQYFDHKHFLIKKSRVKMSLPQRFMHLSSKTIDTIISAPLINKNRAISIFPFIETIEHNETS